ncbi:Scarecrow-like protein 14 [Striga hermonthica]|uniref:Scarecrow-like protein 14 n=1 Tax=Striga hermonthica TaxID=68872 RepID=A0A9N7NTZ1_STRHE|nr:Scarecrow-like protein 14 [Striga hermonthica]
MSDAALRYIDHILMEEDTDDGAHTLQESSDFQETERSFYKPVQTLTGPFDSLTNHIVPSDSSISMSSGLYCIVKHKRSFGGSEVVWDFKEGVPRVANPDPREGKMLHIIGVTIQNFLEGGNDAVKPGEDRARTTKNPLVFTESDIPIEEFDKLLLSTLDDQAIDWSTLLTKCAQMVASGDRRAVAALLTKIRRHSSPTDDWAERLAHYFADGLEARLAGTGTQVYKALAGKRISPLPRQLPQDLLHVDRVFPVSKSHKPRLEQPPRGPVGWLSPCPSHQLRHPPRLLVADLHQARGPSAWRAPKSPDHYR